jgi:hypothetical protein
MCTLALMQRALAAARAADARGGGTASSDAAAPGGDVRMPRRLVAMAGVYDIAKVRCAGGLLWLTWQGLVLGRTKCLHGGAECLTASATRCQPPRPPVVPQHYEYEEGKLAAVQRSTTPLDIAASLRLAAGLDRRGRSCRCLAAFASAVHRRPRRQRMPSMLCLLCPAGRGVHKLSTMERAVGGPQGFADNSPAVILAAALR